MTKISKKNKSLYTQKDAAKDSGLAMSKVEEKKLFQRIVRGDKNARNELMNAHLFLVESVAKKYLKNEKWLSLQELKKLGVKGLRKAIEKYDPKKSYKFSTYASWWIRQAIHLELGIVDEDD